MPINKFYIYNTKKITFHKMNKLRKNRLALIFYSLIILLLDQITKYVILNTISYRESFILIPNILKITLVRNTGAAFSLLSNSTTFLTFISLIVSFVLIIILWKFTPSSKFNNIALPFLLGGTLGNGIDRLFKGYVLDIFELMPFNFPIFNVADIAINIALFFIILELIVKNKGRKQKVMPNKSYPN